MSKNSGKSRRFVPEKEEKRPSVFERLGVRSIANYTSESRWPDTMQGHSSSTRERDTSRPRGSGPLSFDKRQSPSFSPPVKNKEAKLSTPKKSNPNSKRLPRSDEKRGSKKDKQRSADKSKTIIDKKKKKGQKTSSASSGETSDDDSSSSQSSSSSSSTSSNNSSSSDSSVPSVQLNSEKTKAKKPLKSKVLDNSGKKRAPLPATATYHSSRSSSSGVDSSPTKRGPIPIDLREKLNARSPSGGVSKDQYQKKIQPGDKRPKPYNNNSGPLPLLDDRNKKRGPPDHHTSSQDDMKRRRLLSPPPHIGNKYRVGPPEDPPYHHRRAPPQIPMHSEHPKRGRSPQSYHNKDSHQQGQRSTHSSDRRLDLPPRRHPADRPDVRNNDRGDRRNSPYNSKPDYDKRRDPPPEFGRVGGGGDNRPRERVAPPIRSSQMDMRQDRDRMDQRPPNNDYQRRPTQQMRSPYNSSSADQGRNNNNFNNSYNKGSPAPYEMDRQRFPQQNSTSRPDEKRQTLLPKSKEALAERYEQMRKSGYVDKWVDETVKATHDTQRGSEDAPSPLLSTPSSKSALSPARSTTKAEDKDAGKDANKIEAILPPVDDLSDFSDDADELLNVIPPEPPAETEQAVTEELNKSPVLPPKKELAPEKQTVIETPVPIQKRSTSIENTTTRSTISQDRSSLAAKVSKMQTSLPSQSQTDDILDRMDFEEISDEELGEVENRVHIVDALGVDWASLVCQEKRCDEQTSANLSKSTSARKRWRPINILSGRISKKLAGESLYNRILELKKAEDATDSAENDGTQEKGTAKKDTGVLEKIGLGPNSRALSSRRDMAVRRYLLDLPPKNLLSLDLFHNNTTTTTPEMDSIGELYKLSIDMFKASSAVSSS
ncbi:serine/arginine repetitive matrix protein 1 isoform X2 [Folsomia candida]|uniref:serine/arginine repetitive matrix protein 1 isoform X2 n=1 Tax=Folsomia candida TaxID=158441 RepID=UPI000B909B61|nr:serine/arginine repetitive matrix protein 1 isoform X2 [Folsomia candida]